MENVVLSWDVSLVAPNSIVCVLVVIDYGSLLKNVRTDLYVTLLKTIHIFPVQLIWSEVSSFYT